MSKHNPLKRQSQENRSLRHIDHQRLFRAKPMMINLHMIQSRVLSQHGFASASYGLASHHTSGNGAFRLVKDLRGGIA
jgi:hypothetical protein